jgi:hypothetical protein
MSVISAGTTLTTALVQTGDTNGNLVFRTGASGTTALTLGSDQSATFAGAVNITTAVLTNPTINGNVTTTGLNFDSNTLVIDATNNRVGIGTSSPDFQLSLSSDPSFWEAGLQTVITGGDQALRIISNAPGGGGRTGSIEFYTTASERMRIDSSGNVGIGTSSPSSYGKLGVVSGVSYFGVASDAFTSAKFGPRPVNDGAVSVLYEYGGNGSGGYWKTDTTSGSHQLYRIGTIVAEWDSSSNFKFNSGYGSAATAYGCRAWVNFNGTGTPAIRASGNVSSITDLGTGQYRINFTNAMPDANYSTVSGDDHYGLGWDDSYLTTSVTTRRTTSNFSYFDVAIVCVAVFR